MPAPHRAKFPGSPQRPRLPPERAEAMSQTQPTWSECSPPTSGSRKLPSLLELGWSVTGAFGDLRSRRSKHSTLSDAQQLMLWLPQAVVAVRVCGGCCCVVAAVTTAVAVVWSSGCCSAGCRGVCGHYGARLLRALGHCPWGRCGHAVAAGILAPPAPQSEEEAAAGEWCPPDPSHHRQCW